MSLYNCQNCDSCSCGLSPINTPDNVDSSCSVNSIRQTFLEIINAVKNTDGINFNVDVEITTKNGVISTVNFSKLNINNINLTETTLIIDDIAISLCDVVKINVLSAPVLGTTFPATLLNALKNITVNSYYPNKYSKNSSCSNCKSLDVKCAQGMQNYINKNMGSIQTVGYTGSVSEVKDINAVSNITTIDVIENANITSSSTPVLNSASLDIQETPVLNSATISSQTIPVLDSANLATQTTSVTKSVTPNQMQVVDDVVLNNTTLLSGITAIPTEVASPLNTTPTTVISNVGLTAENSFVESIQTTPQQVVGTITPTNGTAVTNIPDGVDITGVVSGITTPKQVTPETINIPGITSTGTGALTITIPATSIDGTNPVAPITINVKSGGQDINFTGNTSKFVLGDGSSIIGYDAGTPASSTVKQIGIPTTDTFVKTIQSTNEQVIKEVTPQNVTGKLVTTADSTTINNVNNPTIKTVIQSVSSTPETVNTVTSVNKVNVDDLFTSEVTDVLSSATLNTTNKNVVSSTTLNKTTENVLSSVTLNTTSENVLESVSLQSNQTKVINGLDETSVTVFAPIKEDIDGKVFAAGDGIMAVNNTNGDISVYSICDINTITT